MSDVDTSQRKRFKPEERKEMILDYAASFIREYGVSALNMDRFGRYAGISKTLVYTYFTNRIGLLKALLLREIKRRQASDRRAIAAAETMEELIELVSWSMLEHVRDHGTVVQQLLLEPEVASVLTDVRAANLDATVDYFAKHVTRDYNIPESVSPAVVEIVLGMGTAASGRLDRMNADINEIHDVLVTLNKGALEAAAHRYGKLRTK